ncbi:MAG: CARDB domain-containing protein [Thermoproteota archaeon]
MGNTSVRKGLAVAVFLVVLQLSLTPPLVAAETLTGDAPPSVFLKSSAGFPVLPLRDVATALEHGVIVTLYLAGPFLERLSLASLNANITLSFSHEIYAGFAQHSSGGILEYSGYSLKAVLSGGHYISQTAALEGMMSFIYSFCSTRGESVAMVLGVRNPSGAELALASNNGLIVIGAGDFLVGIAPVSKEVNVSASREDGGVVRVTVSTSAATSCAELVILVARGSGAESLEAKLRYVRQNLVQLLKESSRYFGGLVSELPLFETNDDVLASVYYLALYSVVNSLSARGILTGDSAADISNVLALASLLKWASSDALAAVALRGIDSLIKRAEEGVEGTAQLVALATLALYDYQLARRGGEDGYLDLYARLKILAERHLVGPLTSGEGIREAPLLVGGSELGAEYLPVYGLVGASLAAMASLSKLQGDDPTPYMLALSKLRKRVDEIFWTGRHYSYVAWSGGKRDASLAEMLLSSYVPSEAALQWREHVEHVASMAAIAPIMPSQGFWLCSSLGVLADAGYAETVYTILARLLNGFEEGTVQDIPGCIASLIIEHMVGLRMSADYVLVTPSLPAKADQVKLFIRVAGLPVHLHVKGYGSSVRSILVNGIAARDSKIPFSTLLPAGENVIVVELESPGRSTLLVTVTARGVPLPNVPVTAVVGGERLQERTNASGKVAFLVPSNSLAIVVIEWNGVLYEISRYVQGRLVEAVVDLESGAVISEKSVFEFGQSTGDVEGWNLYVKVSTLQPWVIGEIANVNVTVSVERAQPNSTFVLSRVGISFRGLETSRYGGSFTAAGEKVALTLALPLVGGAVEASGAGSDVLKVVLEGYVDLGYEKRPYTMEIPVPVYVVGWEPKVSVTISSPEAVKIGETVPVEMRIWNPGDVAATFVTAELYVGDALVYSRSLPRIPPGASAVLSTGIKVSQPGLHNLTARVSFLSAAGPREIVAWKLVKVLVDVHVELKASEVNVTVGEPVELYGRLEPPVPNATVIVEVRGAKELTWQVAAAGVTRGDGTFTLAWKPEVSGAYVLRARFPGALYYSESVSDVVEITVRRASAQLFISAPKPSVKPGEKLPISVKSSALEAVEAILQYQREGESVWRNYTVVKVQPGNSTVVEWVAEEPGKYYLRAVFEGNERVAPALSNVMEVAVVEVQTQSKTVNFQEKAQSSSETPVPTPKDMSEQGSPGYLAEVAGYVRLATMAAAAILGIILLLRGVRMS